MLNTKARSPRSAALAGCLALMLVGLSAPAKACKCATPELVMPAAGALDVPVDARIWLLGALDLPTSGAGAPTLVGPQGEVLVDVGRLAALAPSYAVHVLTPRAPLQAASAFKVVARDRPAPLTTFVTASGAPGGVPPLPPREIARRASAGFLGDSDCGQSWQTIESDVSVEGAVLAVHLTRDDSAPPPPSLALQAPPDGPPYLLVRPGPTARAALGLGSCTVWPRTFTAGWLWYGAFDTTGAFSGWTAGGRIELPALPGDAGADPVTDTSPDTGASADAAGPAPATESRSGCSFIPRTAPGSARIAVAVTLAALLLTRRRRVASNDAAGRRNS
jgi:hypothetical protein